MHKTYEIFYISKYNVFSNVFHSEPFPFNGVEKTFDENKYVYVFLKHCRFLNSV